MEFTHLHVHSHYSMLDGANRIQDLAQTAARQNMRSLALTDHGNLFGAVDFYNAAREAGIKPILGMEAYISPTHRRDNAFGSQREAYSHLLLLAVNDEGWRNLKILSSRAFLEGFYYKARVDRELLAEHQAGLVCTTACISGEVPRALLAGQPDRARRIAGEYLDIFGRERFFIEVQNQGVKDQETVNPLLVDLARTLDVGLVGTNDVHFLGRRDMRTHEVLTCISTNRMLDDPESVMAYSEELYLKSPEEMCAALAPWPEAIRNTMRIAEMADVRMDFTKHLPVFRTPDDSSPGEYLRRIAWDGLRERFGAREIPAAYRERMEWELKVIEDKGYSSYFLIVHDFVSFARRSHIPAAPRGSGVATLLGYALRIADIDPIRYGLLFERFTDPQREEDPDIDIDMCQIGRERVIQYVREKYGHVAQIVTYGTLKARAAIRDVGRVMRMPLDEVDRLSKQVPEDPKITVEDVLAHTPELRRLYENDPRVRDLFDHARNLEGLARNVSVHAAGVVVCDKPLEGLIPLCRVNNGEATITQWDGPTCEKAGMMKMDFLGLRTLTILQCAREMVRERSGEDIDPEDLPLDDQDVFELFRTARTDGVFQFESDGMKGVLQKMQPNRIEDLIAANAMYRPGPMDLIDDYCLRKAGRQEIPSVHPLVDDLLAETYGIMVYQEQVMQVLNRLGQLPMSRALSLIKAISKKKGSVIAAEKPAFVSGAGRNGIVEPEAERLFKLIERFAGYGFNKAHSTRYAIIAYQTAWFKRYHPREFFAATLTYESGDQDKVVQYREDARRFGVEIAPPDINSCGSAFTVDGDRVRFGLKAVKGVGESAVQAIVEARGRADGARFIDLFHFCREADLRAVNRSTIEALIRCGAFDSIRGRAHRAQLLAAIDAAIQGGQAAARDRSSGQMSLFEALAASPDADAAEAAAAAAGVEPAYPDAPPLRRDEMLAAEKDLLGFYITAHPIEEFTPFLRGAIWPRTFSPSRIPDMAQDVLVSACGSVAQFRPIVCKGGAKSSGRKMAFLTLEGLSGERCDVTVFPDLYDRCAQWIEADTLIYVAGRIDRSRKPCIAAEEIQPVHLACETVTERVRLTLGEDRWRIPGKIGELTGLLARHPGSCPVSLRLCLKNGACRAFDMEPGAKWTVKPTRELMAELSSLIGTAGVCFLGRQPVARRERRRDRPRPPVAAG